MSDTLYSGALAPDGTPIALGRAANDGGTFALKMAGLGGAGRNYQGDVEALSPIAYYVLGEDSGPSALDYSGNGFHGIYTGAVVGGADGIGDGNVAPLFDGTGDYITIDAMVAAFDPDLGSVLVWGKTAAWASATQRYLFRAYFDSDNGIGIKKTATLNQLALERTAGGLTAGVESIALAGSTDFFSAALTWDRAGAGLKAYVNGSQVGTTQAGITMFDDAVTHAIVGASTAGGASSWNGALAHVAIWDRALSASEILSVGVL